MCVCVRAYVCVCACVRAYVRARACVCSGFLDADRTKPRRWPQGEGHHGANFPQVTLCALICFAWKREQGGNGMGGREEGKEGKQRKQRRSHWF